MRTGLLVSAALVTALASSVALADRNNDYDNKQSSHSREMKERVLDQQKEGRTAPVRETASRAAAMPSAIKAKVDHRSQGDMYDQFKSNDTRSPAVASHTSRGVAAAAGVPAVFAKKNGEEMIDSSKTATSSSSSSKNYGPMGKQIGWSAGGKSVRSFTHFVNDKGQINNNPHGATATAMHARHQMSVILHSVLPANFKIFSWEGSGGDASEDQF